jgi:acyl-CoA thioester hydrolase
MMAPMQATFPWPYVLELPVRFRDLDAFGHVNNAVFLTFLEQARTDCYLAMLGRTDPFRSGAGLDFVVARAEIDYLLPVLHGELLQISVNPLRLGTSSFDFGYEARIRSGELAARGKTVLVAYDHEGRKSRPLPDALAAQLRAGLPEGTS